MLATMRTPIGVLGELPEEATIVVWIKFPTHGPTFHAYAHTRISESCNVRVFM
ncbi:hypothetical protein J2S98_004572 [Arthrobacter oryzae]|nr:hypothetical protein [Arthrobacter oryzae]